MSAQPLPEAPARFAQGEPLTILVSSTAADEWQSCAPGGRTHLMLGSRLADGTFVTVPCDYPGITVIHGDIRPTLLQALADAIQYRDCRTSDECAGWRDQYEKAMDVLGADP
jgi:hypothetical protein